MHTKQNVDAYTSLQYARILAKLVAIKTFLLRRFTSVTNLSHSQEPLQFIFGKPSVLVGFSFRLEKATNPGRLLTLLSSQANEGRLTRIVLNSLNQIETQCLWENCFLCSSNGLSTSFKLFQNKQKYYFDCLIILCYLIPNDRFYQTTTIMAILYQMMCMHLCSILFPCTEVEQLETLLVVCSSEFLVMRFLQFLQFSLCSSLWVWFHLFPLIGSVD